MEANLLPCNAVVRLQARTRYLLETRERFMAKIIAFYVPSSFRKKATKWIPPEELGKVIPFDTLQKKSA